jgi:hypothetical protein
MHRGKCTGCDIHDTHLGATRTCSDRDVLERKCFVLERSRPRPRSMCLPAPFLITSRAVSRRLAQRMTEPRGFPRWSDACSHDDAMALFILPGRHQPPHNDHLALIRAALEVVPGTLLVGLVFQRAPHSEPADAFEAEARAQNSPERCPFTVLERLELFEESLDEALPPAARARVRVIPLPRPEAEWPLVQALLPGPRTWIVPALGEPFDDAKASFFQARGDAVLRVALRPTTDGRLVRSLLDDPDRLAHHVPAAVARRIALWRREKESTR